jgi:hypothetical protein
MAGGRFGRERQRRRAAQADAEADEAVERVWRLSRFTGRLPYLAALRWAREVGRETVPPYRGFRAGRSRVRPEKTGYDEPATLSEHPWLDGLEGVDPILGDEDDENYPTGRR